jgi:hypothetical protein
MYQTVSLSDDASDSKQLELQKILNGNLSEQKHSGQICSITLIMFSAIQLGIVTIK